MKTTSSVNATYPKRVINPTGAEFAALAKRADAFICAAGFEARSLRAPMAVVAPRKMIVVAYKNGPKDNDTAFKEIHGKFGKMMGFEVCVLDLNHLEKFDAAFEAALKTVTDLTSGEIVLDISGMPNFAISLTVAKVRKTFPTERLILLYTEAEEYYPLKKDYERFKASEKSRPFDVGSEYLSGRAVNLFIPSQFNGVTLGHNDTCLIVFAGYEPHRTTCAIEALNPSKLVMVYSKPGRSDLMWRYDLSRLMHGRLDDQLKRTEETSSTSEVDDNLRLILEYYEYLYDDHVISISPINSKIHAVAATLAWETYPDIQLNFPMPARYLPRQFTRDWRATFILDLGLPAGARMFLPFEANGAPRKTVKKR